MKTLNYYQTLEIVENFMTETGIRKFCTEICKGGCCSSLCYGTDNACTKNEGRRLACSSFVCPFPSYPDVLYCQVIEGHDVIKKVVTDICLKNNHRDTNKGINIYFFRPHPTLFTDFKVEYKPIKASFVKPIKRVKTIISEILNYCVIVNIPNRFSPRLHVSKLRYFHIKHNNRIFHGY